MHKKFIFLVVLALLALALPASALAQSATGQTWTSSITYYTPSTAGGTLQVDFIAADGTTYSATAIQLAAHKAGSLLVGSVSTVPTGFAGSAVLSSDVAVVATAVQFSATANQDYGRMLYSGFTADDAAAKFYVPTLIYQNGTTSQVGVQNIEAFDITATMKVYAPGAATPTGTLVVDIPAGSSKIFTGADTTPALPAGFTGSLVIEATKKGDAATPGRVVAAAQETRDTGRQAYAFEGSAQGANKLYMASMLCKNGATAQQISYYAIQNADTVPADITIKAYNTAGTQVGSTFAATIQPGNKLSVNPCQAGFDVPANTSGSAVIESTGGKIIAIGKVNSNDGLATAFVGQPAGNLKIAAPYVRWAADGSPDFRAFLAIMNVGTAAATDVKVNYYDGNGALAGSQTLVDASTPLAPFVKRNSTAPQANALNATTHDFGFHPIGGAVEVVSDQPVVLVVRLLRTVNFPGVTTLGEDYNGVAVP